MSSEKKSLNLQVTDQELVEELIKRSRSQNESRQVFEEQQGQALAYLVAQFQAWSEMHIRVLNRAHVRIETAKIERTFESQAEAAAKLALENTSDYVSEWGRYAHQGMILLGALVNKNEVLEKFAMQSLNTIRAMAGDRGDKQSMDGEDAVSLVKRAVAEANAALVASAKAKRDTEPLTDLEKEEEIVRPRASRPKRAATRKKVAGRAR